MKRTKASSLCQELSEQNDLSKHLVESLTDFYYKNVKTLLSELHHPRINIVGLGLFTVKERTVKKAIPRFENYLKNHDTSTYSAYYNKKMLEEKVEFLQCMSEQIDSEKKRKEEFKNVKNGSKKDLEK